MIVGSGEGVGLRRTPSIGPGCSTPEGTESLVGVVRVGLGMTSPGEAAGVLFSSMGRVAVGRPGVLPASCVWRASSFMRARDFSE